MNADTVRQYWEERSGEYSPDYYAYYGPNEVSESIRALLDTAVDRDAAILELGCSAGRHLSHLFEEGYENLSGIDINNQAFDVMADAYPDLAAAGTFYTDAIENAVTEFDDNQFDVVYSVETLQHIHPDDAWVFEELARITDDLIVTVENEGTDEQQSAGESVNYVNDEIPLYYRDWNRVFTEFGFVEIESRATKRDTLRAFRSE